MRWIFRMLGHGFGIVGALIGVGSVSREIDAHALPLIPYAHSLTRVGVGAPLSLALMVVAILLIEFGRGG